MHQRRFTTTIAILTAVCSLGMSSVAMAGGDPPAPAPKPKPTPKPTPTPTPTGPVLVQEDGTWNACGASFCLGGTALDLGSPSVLGNTADADFDGDGAVEHNADEFTGLVGKHVSLKVEHNQGGFVVYVIDGHGLRNADGSFARTAASTTASGTTP